MFGQKSQIRIQEYFTWFLTKQIMFSQKSSEIILVQSVNVISLII